MEVWQWVLIGVIAVAVLIWRKSAQVRAKKAELVFESLQLESEILTRKQAAISSLRSGAIDIQTAEREMQHLTHMFRTFHHKCSVAFMEMHPEFVDSFSRMAQNLDELNTTINQHKGGLA